MQKINVRTTQDGKDVFFLDNGTILSTVYSICYAGSEDVVYTVVYTIVNKKGVLYTYSPSTGKRLLKLSGLVRSNVVYLVA